MTRLQTRSRFSMMCATAVVFPCAGLCLSLVGQPLEWYHANHVFGPVYVAVVAFRPQLPVPSCDRSSVAHPRCVCGRSSGLAHGSPPHSPPRKRQSRQTCPVCYWWDRSRFSYRLVSSWMREDLGVGADKNKIRPNLCVLS